jgi:hypothetical protein
VCCGGLKHRIGEDVSERLDVIPAQFKVIVTRRPKYPCQACAGEVVQAPAPERLIENGIPTEALVAKVSRSIVPPWPIGSAAYLRFPRCCVFRKRTPGPPPFSDMN